MLWSTALVGSNPTSPENYLILLFTFLKNGSYSFHDPWNKDDMEYYYKKENETKENNIYGLPMNSKKKFDKIFFLL